MKHVRVVMAAMLAVALAAGVTLGATLRDGGSGATAQTATTPTTALPANPPTCTAKTLGVSRASNPGLAADCDTLLAIKSTLRASGRINYDTPLWRDHHFAFDWSARSPIRYWSAVTLGGTPLRVTGLDFSDTREHMLVYNARTRMREPRQPYTREWTLRGVIPTQLGSLTALEVLDFGDSELTGVVPTQLGNLTRLRTLDLSDNRLTGALPWELDDLDSLGRVGLSGNAFTGCAPAELWRVTTHDLATLGLPNCKPPLTYEAPSWTGIVDAPGEHAFFTNRGPAITYEALRNDVIQVVIDKRDSGGVMRSAIYDDIEAGDDFEWREADDCWVRYLVEEVLPDPTDVPLKVLAVKRYGYAYTGCTGQVSLTGSRTLTWIPPNIRGADITVPVRHGPWLLVNSNFEGNLESQQQRPAPQDGDQVGGASAEAARQECSPSNYWEAVRCGRERSERVQLLCQTSSLEEARRCKGWREPAVPEGWVFSGASQGVNTLGNPPNAYNYGYYYRDQERGYPALEVVVFYEEWQPQYFGTGGSVVSGRTYLDLEVNLIDGRPSLLQYNSRPGNKSGMHVRIFDEDTGISYTLRGHSPDLRGPDITALIQIARSMFVSAEAFSQNRIASSSTFAIGAYEYEVEFGVMAGSSQKLNCGWHSTCTTNYSMIDGNGLDLRAESSDDVHVFFDHKSGSTDLIVSVEYIGCHTVRATVMEDFQNIRRNVAIVDYVHVDSRVPKNLRVALHHFPLGIPMNELPI